MIWKMQNSEEGFLSAFLIIFLVTLALMGAGAFILVNSEGINMVNQVQLLQSGYAGDGAAYYAIRALRRNVYSNPTYMTIGGASVTLDTSMVAERIFLDVEADMSEVQNMLEIQLRVDSLQMMAIISTDNVSGIDTRDSLGNVNQNYLIENTDSIPGIDDALLQSTSGSQLHDQSAATFTPSDGYPFTGSFFYSGSEPNVTWVQGNFYVQGGYTVYGIFLVDGDVVIGNDATVEGVIYTPDENSDIYIDRSSSSTHIHVNGGIISNGEVSAYNLGTYVNVQHDPDHMNAFGRLFLYNPSCILAHVFEWNYM